MKGSHVGSTFAENFQRTYVSECERYPLSVVLEAFYVYIGCSNKFAVTEVWRVNKHLARKS